MNQKTIKARRGIVNRRDVLKFGLAAGLPTGLSAALYIAGCSAKKRLSYMPNIFLITIDTLRADHLGCCAYPKPISPNIDRFAADALLFERCFSHAPETRSSFASILTGFLPHETKVLQNGLLLGKAELLSEILHGYGYDTAAVISNYVLRRGEGFEQGFDVFDDTMNERELIRQIPEKIAEGATNRSIELIKKFSKKPVFMWLHYQDPHGPYTPPGGYAMPFYDKAKKRLLKFNESLTGRGGIPTHQRLGNNRNYYYYLAQYDGEIRYMDEHVGRLFNALADSNKLDNSIIIFTSDHGEGMGEHNYFFAHIDYLYNTLTHVPLIIRCPAVSPGRRTDYVQHLDIVPTILNILGAETSPHYRGRDLRKKGETPGGIFAAMSSPLVKDGIKYSIILDKLKLIYTPIDNSFELFNLQTDFAEQKNLANRPDYGTKMQNLKLKLSKTLDEDFLKLGTVRNKRSLSEQERENLRSLGYVE